MFVSVIIPTYNSSTSIANTIDSCLCQSDYIKEIIIVDDFSVDNTWEILNEISRKSLLVKIFKNEHKGGNNARNYGLSKASGKYIQWLDSDDLILDTKLAKQVEFMSNNVKVDVVYSDWTMNIISETFETIQYKKNKAYVNYLKELLIDNWSPLHVYLIKYEVAIQLQQENLWNPHTLILQDREYFTICAALGYEFQYLTGNFAQYNRYNYIGSVSRNKIELKDVTIVILMKTIIYKMVPRLRNKEIEELIYLNFLNSVPINKEGLKTLFENDFIFVLHKIKLGRNAPIQIAFNLIHGLKSLI